MACPSDDQLGGLVQRSLDVAEAAAVTSHLDECDGCRQIVIAAVRGGMARGTPSLGTTVNVRGGSRPPTARSENGPAIGDRVGRYEIRALLGAGGMGRVYEAFDPELDRAVALKVLRPELGARHAGGAMATLLAERLVRESRLMARIAHPAVISVHDVGRTGDAVFIAMELVRGETLGAYVRRAQPRWQEIVELLARAGEGLEAAHACGIIHRDFKPENVLVELDGDGRAARVVVTDFGVARAFADDDEVTPTGTPPADVRDLRLTATGSVIGTPAYMAPEQLDGRRVDRRADVFAFAVTAWELVFDRRPFTGASAAELRAAMRTLPAPPDRPRLPRSIVRALRRGLAEDAAARWPDMPAFVAALTSGLRSRRRPIVLAAAAALVIGGVGVAAGAVVGDREVDPCQAGRDAIAAALPPGDIPWLHTALAGQSKAADIVAKLEKTSATWRATHDATCKRDATPAQPAATATCLDARRRELEGFVESLRLDGDAGRRHAGSAIGLVEDPALCGSDAPPSGLLSARVPADPAVRRSVAAFRYELFGTEAARDRGDSPEAIATARSIATQARTVWPPLEAEAMYVLATSLYFGGNNVEAAKTLRETAALAERVHHDYIAANVWLQLAHAAAFDDGDPARALEYLTYAGSAIERVGSTPDLVVMLEYIRGATLVEANRHAEAEAAIQKAFDLAAAHAPEHLGVVIQAFGFLYEDQAKYAEAVTAYRRALDKLHVPATEVTIRNRLASALSSLGRNEEAEAEARRAVALADRTIHDDNLDRAVARVNLAEVLAQAGKRDEALAEIRGASRRIVAVLGDRSERYGEVLAVEATILGDLGRHDEAIKAFARACDVIAFTTGEGSAQQADCWVGQTDELYTAGRVEESLAIAERAVPALIAAYGEEHPQVATAMGLRGMARAELGKAGGIKDLERAYAQMASHEIDAGHLAGLEWALGYTLWNARRDRVRAHQLVRQANERFAKASGSWQDTHADVKAWLAKHPTAPRR